MSIIQEKFNDLSTSFMRLVSVQIGFRVNDSDPSKLILEADSSIPARGTGLWLILLSLLPFHSDFLEDPSTPGIFNGYDFYNHEWSIPLRFCIALPELWIFFVWGKFTKCVFDKNANTFSIKQRISWIEQKEEGNLQEISSIEILPVEKLAWLLFSKEPFTHFQVNLIKHSGEVVSFFFIERKSEVDSVIVKYRNVLCEFLNLSVT
jgi:hypothetical protein